MKYAVVQCSNGVFSVVAEGFTDPEKAIPTYADTMKAFHNAKDVEYATVAIVDENYNIYSNYKDVTNHRPTPEPTPEPES